MLVKFSIEHIQCSRVVFVGNANYVALRFNKLTILS